MLLLHNYRCKSYSRLEERLYLCRQTGEHINNRNMPSPADIRYIPPAGRDGGLLNSLTALWESSVRATHHFLREADIKNLKPYVTEALAGIRHLYVAADAAAPTAFIGIQDEKIEMLFVSPQHLRKGIGKRLVDMAVRNHGAAFVDVNEQNPAARAFYEKLGFVESGRTETDGQGNPFPIIEMRRKDFHIQTKDLSTKRT